jgi:uncharacterized caspase-like protein
MASPIYSPLYTTSYALVIGINDYLHVPPLRFAVADAEAVAEILQTRFNFPKDNVQVLLNAAASRAAVLESFFSHQHSETDSRFVVFFAGHGHTTRGLRGDVGFLVPHDGNPTNLGSLLRWQELTHGADVLAPKHIVFLMDACYGGLAVTRALPPGSMRFIRDMLKRPARQVLTAGKANEPVGDLGGPLPDHSPFTGHLLEGLDGKAAAGRDGVITAQSVMAYVYEAVGRDGRSRQTPHFGHLDGDGDLIFHAPVLEPQAQAEAAAAKVDEDSLVAVPVVDGGATVSTDDVIVRAKELLSEDRHRIQLHETVSQQTRRVILEITTDQFPVQGGWSNDEFISRIGRYQSLTERLRQIEALIGFWGTQATQNLTVLAPRRMSDHLQTVSGNVGLVALRWYPVLLLVYSGGIAATFGGKYGNLRALLDTPVPGRRGDEALIAAVVHGLSELGDAFKLLPGQERHYTPRSEHLFKLLQPELDDLLFMGSDYHVIYDRFEIFMCLEYMQKADRDWAPVGRFGWKARSGDSHPFQEVLREAEQEQERWPPLQAGLFGGTYTRFTELAARLRGLISQLQWF